MAAPTFNFEQMLTECASLMRSMAHDYDQLAARVEDMTLSEFMEAFTAAHDQTMVAINSVITDTIGPSGPPD